MVYFFLSMYVSFFVPISVRSWSYVPVGSRNETLDIRALSLYHEVAPRVIFVGIVTWVANFVEQ